MTIQNIYAIIIYIIKEQPKKQKEKTMEKITKIIKIENYPTIETIGDISENEFETFIDAFNKHIENHYNGEYCNGDLFLKCTNRIQQNLGHTIVCNDAEGYELECIGIDEGVLELAYSAGYNAISN